MQYLRATLFHYRTVMDEDIAARLTRLAKEQNLDATALSRVSGLKEGAIYKLLRGDQKTTSIQAGLKLAAALGVDPWYLAFGKERSNVTRLRPAEPDEWRPRDLDEAESLSQDGFAAIALLQSQLDELRQEMQLVRDRLPEVGTKPSPKGRRSG